MLLSMMIYLCNITERTALVIAITIFPVMHDTRSRRISYTWDTLELKLYPHILLLSTVSNSLLCFRGQPAGRLTRLSQPVLICLLLLSTIGFDELKKLSRSLFFSHSYPCVCVCVWWVLLSYAHVYFTFSLWVRIRTLAHTLELLRFHTIPYCCIAVTKFS